MWPSVILIAMSLCLVACGNHDTTQLQVTSYSPTANAVAVPTDATVSATFSEPIAPSSVNSTSFALANQGGSISGTFRTSSNTITFVPDRPLSLLSKYTATISPSVYGAYGHLLTQPYQWSFTTRDGLWETLTSYPQDAEKGSNTVAIDDSGRVLLVWLSLSGTFASFYVNGVWTPPTQLSLPGGYLNSVVASHDSFAVFWQARSNNTIQMYCSRYLNEAWQPTEVIASVDAATVYIRPTIFDDNSLLVIYWFNGGADGNHAYYKRYVINQGWQASTPLPEQNAWFSTGFHRSGKAVIAWNTPDSIPDNSFRTGYAQSYDVNSGWAAPVVVGHSKYLLAHYASINSSGLGMVEFTDQSNYLFTSTTINGGWTPLLPICSRPSGVLGGPDLIVVDNLGNAMFITFQWSTNVNQIVAIRYDKDKGWGQPVDVGYGRFPDPMQFSSNLLVDESGNFHLIWYGYDPAAGRIEHVYSSKYQVGVGWRAPIIISRQDADAAFARMAINPRGEVASVWETFYPAGFTNFTMGLEVALFH